MVGAAIPGGSVSNWSRLRLALSRVGNLYARVMLGIPLHDATSGYRVYRRALLERLVAEPFHADGYGFQVELVLRAWLDGWSVGEVPIAFREREHGHSKLAADRVRGPLARDSVGRRAPGPRTAVPRGLSIRRRLRPRPVARQVRLHTGSGARVASGQDGRGQARRCRGRPDRAWDEPTDQHAQARGLRSGRRDRRRGSHRHRVDLPGRGSEEAIGTALSPHARDRVVATKAATPRATDGARSFGRRSRTAFAASEPSASSSTTFTASTPRHPSRRAWARSRSIGTRGGSGMSVSRRSGSSRSNAHASSSPSPRFRTSTTSTTAAGTTSSTTAPARASRSSRSSRCKEPAAPPEARPTPPSRRSPDDMAPHLRRSRWRGSCGDRR